MITTVFLDQEFPYTGPELRSLFLYEKGIKGDGVLSWVGSCDVKTQDLVDAEDKVTNDFIKSKKMVHFVAEFFHKDVFFAICVQRLTAEIVIDVLNSLSSKTFVRKGDDIYCDHKKLNVSIATVSPLSALMHFGVNIDSEGAPVPAVGLKDLNIDPDTFAKQVLSRLKEELESIYAASVKVFSV